MESRDKVKLAEAASREVSLQLIELEAELKSLDTRIDDLQWQYEMGVEGIEPDEILNQRRKAIDKKKYIINDIANLRRKLVANYVGE